MRTKSILSPAKQKKCADWLVAHDIVACPLCHAQGLEIRDVVLAPVFDTEAQAPQAHSVPMLAVECPRCLHVALFDAVRMGLMGKGN